VIVEGLAKIFSHCAKTSFAGPELRLSSQTSAADQTGNRL
jgi:hypothetical protein